MWRLRQAGWVYKQVLGVDRTGMKLEMQREQSRRHSDCGADVTSIPAGHMKTDPFCKAVCFGQTMFDILVPAPILSEYAKICHIY